MTTNNIYSVVLLIPAALQEQANALGEALGWGDLNFRRPVYPASGGEVSHYICRADAWQEFIDMLSDPPPEAVEAGAGDILPHLIVDVQPRVDPLPQVMAVLEAHGLVFGEDEG